MWTEWFPVVERALLEIHLPLKGTDLSSYEPRPDNALFGRSEAAAGRADSAIVRRREELESEVFANEKGAAKEAGDQIKVGGA